MTTHEKALRALAQAYDREDAAQRGEPDPWNLDDPGDIGDSDTRVSERLACAEVAARAGVDEGALKAIVTHSVANDCWTVRVYPYKSEAEARAGRAAILAYLEASAPKAGEIAGLYTSPPPVDVLVDALEGIYQYADDTLSGPADGPDDRAWQLDCVVEVRNRARAALAVAKGGK